MADRLNQLRLGFLVAFLLIFSVLLGRNLWLIKQNNESFEYLHRTASQEVLAYLQDRSGPDPQKSWWKVFWAMGQSHQDREVKARASQLAITMLANMRHYEKIVSLVEQVGPSHPGLDQALNQIEAAHFAEGRLESYLKFAREMANVHPDPIGRGSAVINLARLQIRRGDYNAAEEAIRTYVAHPSMPTLHAIVEGLRYEIKMLRPGMKAPNFSVSDIEGNPIPVKDVQGKNRLILFWSSKCQPSSLLFEACMTAPPPEMTVLAVALGDELNDVLPMITEEQPGFIVEIEPGEKFKGPLARLFNVSATPTAYLLSKDGMILKKAEGRTSILDMISITFWKKSNMGG